MIRFVGTSLAIVVILLVPVGVAAAQNTPVVKPDLELRLKPGKLLNGVPETFTFELVNISDHDVYFPKPKADCNSALNGSIWLQLDFTPAQFNNRGSGFVCVEDQVGLPAIMHRVKDWRPLHPGETISQTLDQRELHFDDKGSGRYVFWAEYHPPTIDQRDQSTLQQAGIDFPQKYLKTAQFIYKVR